MGHPWAPSNPIDPKTGEPLDAKPYLGPGVEVVAYNLDPRKPRFTKAYNPQGMPTMAWPQYPMTPTQKAAWFESQHPGEAYIDVDPWPDEPVKTVALAGENIFVPTKFVDIVKSLIDLE